VNTRRITPISPRRKGFTLVEVMIVVGILGVILMIAGPTWVRQRELSRLRSCQENLSKIQGAKEQWALENSKPGSAEPAWDDLCNEEGSGYLQKEPVCPAEGDYTIGAVGETASCSITEPFDHNALGIEESE
jgi:prepilin-type N-terminal cleavage/methylation domain-containing protein